MSQEIWSPIISAVAALSGVGLSQLTSVFHASKERRHKRIVLLREKYEQMALLYADSLSWLQAVSASTTLAELHALSVPEKAVQMKILCLVYFPDLLESVNEYLNSTHAFYTSLLKDFNPSIDVPAAYQAQVRDEHIEITKLLANSKQKFDKALTQYADKYVKA